MGIEFRNLTDKTIIIELVQSELRKLEKYPLEPKNTFTVNPGESGLIHEWIPRSVSFSHEATSAHVDIGKPAMRVAGLDGASRPLKRFLAQRSKTIRGLSIRFTPVKQK